MVRTERNESKADEASDVSNLAAAEVVIASMWCAFLHVLGL